MLVSYSIKGFKSIKKKIDINLETTNYKMLSDRNVNGKYLKGIMFAGANGSGKSNILLAIKLLLDKLLAKDITDFKKNSCLFSDDKSIELEYMFNIKGANIRYKFGLNCPHTYEELVLDENTVLSRNGSKAKTVLTDKECYDNLDNDVLFLREIYFNTNFREHKDLQNWFEFLKNSVYIDMYNPAKIEIYNGSDLTINSFVKDYGVEKINDFLKTFNFDQNLAYEIHVEDMLRIKSIIKSVSEITSKYDFKNNTKFDGKKISKMLNSKEINKDILSLDNLNMYLSSIDKELLVYRKDVSTPIPIDLESLGNSNLYNFLPALFHVLNNDALLLVDEFSSGFHNNLEELLLSYFMANAKSSQMIFVSHSTNLMDNTLLRPDQIYAAQFNGTEGSSVTRFSKHQPREAQNIEKMYLGGVFGGLPNYEDPE